MLPFIHVGDARIGPFPIHPFGLLVALAVIIGSQLAVMRARKRGIDLDLLNTFLTWMLVAGFSGGHMLDEIFYHPQDVIRSPVTLVGLWLGLSSFGGFSGGLIGVFLWKRFRTALPRHDEDPNFGQAAQGFWIAMAGLASGVWHLVTGSLPLVGGGRNAHIVTGIVLLFGIGMLLKSPPKTVRGRRPLLGGVLGLVSGAVIGTIAGTVLWRAIGKEYALHDDAIRSYCFDKLHLSEAVSAGVSFGAMAAVIGVALGWFLLSIERRKSVIPVFPLIDLILSIFPAAWIFGRSGCSVVHDHPGKITTPGSLLAVGYPTGNEINRDKMIEFIHGSIVRYDLGLLELMFTILLSACIALTWGKRLPTGSYIVIVSLAYAPVRFAMDYLRITDGHDADPRYGSLTPAQWCCIVVFAAGLGVVAYMLNNKRRGVDPIEAILIPQTRVDLTSEPTTSLAPQ